MPIRARDLRHTFASWLVNEGKASLKTAQKLLGHRKIATTTRCVREDENGGAVVRVVLGSPRTREDWIPKARFNRGRYSARKASTGDVMLARNAGTQEASSGGYGERKGGCQHHAGIERARAVQLSAQEQSDGIGQGQPDRSARRESARRRRG